MTETGAARSRGGAQPGAGRTEVGNPVHVRLGMLLPRVDGYAAAQGVSRAEGIRQLVELSLLEWERDMKIVMVDGRRTPVQYAKSERLEEILAEMEKTWLGDRTDSWLHPRGQCGEKRCRDANDAADLREAIEQELRKREANREQVARSATGR